MIPKYYGVAYLEMNRLVAIAYPIPLNILVGFFRKVWFWFKAPKQLFKNGYDKGYLEGKEAGRKYAFNQYKTQALQSEVKTIVDNFLHEYQEMFRKSEHEQTGWIWKFIDKETERIKERF